VADQPRHPCVVASDWLRSGEFIAALRALLRQQEPLAIIMDRRRGGSLIESGLEDRRRQPQVDLALATNGFAVVPASVNPKDGWTQVSLLLPEVPIEPLFPTDDEDLKRLESIRSFQRRRSGRPIPKLGAPFLKGLQMVQHFVEVRHALPILIKLLAVLIGVTLATVVLSPAGQNLGKSLMGRMFQGSPPTSGGQAAARPATQLPSARQPSALTDEASTPAQLPAVTEKPTVAETQPARAGTSAQVRPASESLPSGSPASTKQAPLRDADRLIATPRVTGPPLIKGTGTTSRETGTTSTATSTSPNETSVPPKAATAQDSSGRSRPSAAVRPSPSAPPESKPIASSSAREAATSKATRPRFAGSPRVVLAREPVSLAWGKSYAVRLLNRAGQPMAGAEVWLVARRTDGTVENIPMGALPELGTYRATVPTRRSAPIDLRIRVGTGNERVEVPVKP
jgi:hypothetical protein